MILTNSGAWREATRYPHEIRQVFRKGRLIAVLVIAADGGVNAFDPLTRWCGRFADEQRAREALKLPMETVA
jgi:hypothetical protein